MSDRNIRRLIVATAFLISFFFCGLVCAESIVSKRANLYVAKDGEVEQVSERTRGFKKYKSGPRQYRVGGQVGPIHYRTDPFSDTEQYKEIDLDILLTPGEPWDAACETNGYQVRFWNSRNIGGKVVRCVVQFRRAGKWIAIAPLALIWENTAGQRQLISKPQAGIIPTIDNDTYRVMWSNLFGSGLHYRYNLYPDEFFKTVIIDNKTDLPVPTIGLAGLKLTVILGISWHGNSEPANGFSSGIIPSVLPNGADESSIDEELVNSDKFAFRDEFLRNVFWLQRPRAWDSAEPRHDVDLEWRLKRRGNFVYAALSVVAAVLDNVNVVYPVYVDVDMAEEDVGSDQDDGSHQKETSHIYTRVTDMLIAGRSTATSYAWSANFRFQTVPIPAGVTITAATLTMTAYSTVAGITVNTRVQLEDRGDAPFIDDDADFDASIANVTTAFATWNNVPAFTDGVEYTSPDFASSVHEVVNGVVGWNSGQDMMVFWHDDGANSVDDGAYRYVSAHEFSGAAEVAHFNVSYEEGAPQVLRVISH